MRFPLMTSAAAVVLMMLVIGIEAARVAQSRPQQPKFNVDLPIPASRVSRASAVKRRFLALANATSAHNDSSPTASTASPFASDSNATTTPNNNTTTTSAPSSSIFDDMPELTPYCESGAHTLELSPYERRTLFYDYTDGDWWHPDTMYLSCFAHDAYYKNATDCPLKSTTSVVDCMANRSSVVVEQCGDSGGCIALSDLYRGSVHATVYRFSSGAFRVQVRNLNTVPVTFRTSFTAVSYQFFRRSKPSLPNVNAFAPGIALSRRPTVVGFALERGAFEVKHVVAVGGHQYCDDDDISSEARRHFPKAVSLGNAKYQWNHTFVNPGMFNLCAYVEAGRSKGWLELGSFRVHGSNPAYFRSPHLVRGEGPTGTPINFTFYGTGLAAGDCAKAIRSTHSCQSHSDFSTCDLDHGRDDSGIAIATAVFTFPTNRGGSYRWCYRRDGEQSWRDVPHFDTLPYFTRDLIDDLSHLDGGNATDRNVTDGEEDLGRPTGDRPLVPATTSEPVTASSSSAAPTTAAATTTTQSPAPPTTTATTVEATSSSSSSSSPVSGAPATTSSPTDAAAPTTAAPTPLPFQMAAKCYPVPPAAPWARDYDESAYLELNVATAAFDPKVFRAEFAATVCVPDPAFVLIEEEAVPVPGNGGRRQRAAAVATIKVYIRCQLDLCIDSERLAYAGYLANQQPESLPAGVQSAAVIDGPNNEIEIGPAPGAQDDDDSGRSSGDGGSSSSSSNKSTTVAIAICLGIALIIIAVISVAVCVRFCGAQGRDRRRREPLAQQEDELDDPDNDALTIDLPQDHNNNNTQAVVAIAVPRNPCALLNSELDSAAAAQGTVVSARSRHLPPRPDQVVLAQAVETERADAPLREADVYGGMDNRNNAHDDPFEPRTQDPNAPPMSDPPTPANRYRRE